MMQVFRRKIRIEKFRLQTRKSLSKKGSVVDVAQKNSPCGAGSFQGWILKDIEGIAGGVQCFVIVIHVEFGKNIEGTVLLAQLFQKLIGVEIFRLPPAPAERIGCRVGVTGGEVISI